MGVARAGVLLLALALLAGCAQVTRLPPPPPDQTVSALVVGRPDARLWFDEPPGPLVATLERSLARRAGLPGPRNFLVLSGGGDDGAFGAGLLTGWTARGDRPEFDVVTGISAGALIAPFAFLGPAYDGALREVFTELQPRDLVLLRYRVAAVLFGDALADTSPLYQVIARYADEALLAAVGREYARGRLLLVGTVNLDLQRPVIWNMGAIAASGHPLALDLFRRVLLASASIPGAFPPVMMDVELDARRFQEMHVDGGAAMQLFLYPEGVRVPRDGRQRTVHVIRNGRVERPFEEGARRGIFSIARRAAETLLDFSARGDIARLYLLAERDALRFRLAAIDPGFRAQRPEPFAPSYMRALFAHGEEVGRTGRGWLESPVPGAR
jgi:hypothetical protein